MPAWCASLPSNWRRQPRSPPLKIRRAAAAAPPLTCLMASLVAALEAQGQSPRAVAFEMIPAWRQLEIVEYLSAGGDSEGLGEVLAWSASGWPEWSSYQPIAEAALANEAQIVGADLGIAE